MRLKTRANMCNTPGPQQPGNNNNEILKPGGGEPEPEPSGAEPEKDASTATNGKEGRESGSAGYSGPTGGESITILLSTLRNVDNLCTCTTTLIQPVFCIDSCSM